MGRHGIKDYKIDTLLRNEVFIDLYNVIRNGVLIGEPSWLLKILSVYTVKKGIQT